MIERHMYWSSPGFAEQLQENGNAAKVFLTTTR